MYRAFNHTLWKNQKYLVCEYSAAYQYFTLTLFTSILPVVESGLPVYRQQQGAMFRTTRARCNSTYATRSTHEEALIGSLVACARSHIGTRPEVGQVRLADEGGIVVQQPGRPQIAR